MRRREKKLIQRFVLLLVGTFLAMLIGGAIGVWMHPGTQMFTRKSRKALYVSPEVLTEKRLSELTKTKDSPETLKSGDLCYYAALHHATGHRFELSLLFLDALEERFPNSPFAQETKTLRPLIETARAGVDSSKQAAVAQALLAVEALPLSTDSYLRDVIKSLSTPQAWGRRIRSLTAVPTSPHPWWRSLPEGSVTLAPPDSRYAGWPVEYTRQEDSLSNPFLPRDKETMVDIEAVRKQQGSNRQYGLRSFQTFPVNVLTQLARTSVPVLRNHLSDPRLVGVSLNPDPDTPSEPETVGRICYELLCETAGFKFHDIKVAPAQNGSQPKQLPFPLSRRVLAHIDRWMAECIEMDQAETLRWHLRDVSPKHRSFPRYVSQLKPMGHSQATLDVVLDKLDPDDPETTLTLAQAAVTLGDFQTVAIVAQHIVEGRSTDVGRAVQLVAKYGSSGDKASVYAYLQALPVPGEFEEELAWLEQLAVLGDTSRLPGLIERFLDDSLLESRRYRDMVAFIARQNWKDGNRAIVKKCLEALAALTPPETTVDCDEHADSAKALQLFRIYCEPVAQGGFTATQKVRVLGAFLDWRTTTGTNSGYARSDRNVSRVRICDVAAQKLCEQKFFPSGYTFLATEGERDALVDIVRQELKKRFPMPTEPTQIPENSK